MLEKDSLSISERLSRFARSIQYDRLPPQVLQQAKMCILDAFANMLACRVKGEQDILTEMMDQFSPGDEATAFGLFRKGSCSDVAMINGVMARILDLDDGHKEARVHPGAVLVPTVFALGEKENVSGKQILVALVIGYETFIRLGRAVNPAHRNRGFDSTGTVGVFASAMAASHLLKLNTDRMVWALGIAGSLAGGLNESVSDGSMPKNLHPGFSARNGILSAQLARAGLSGPRAVFEGKSGFLRAFVGEGKEENIIKYFDEASGSFGILDVYFKRHACMRRIHAAVDAMIEIAKQRAIRPGAVEKILVHTSSYVAQLNNPVPTTLVAAQGSVPYSIAVALLYGKAGIDEFTLDRLGDPQIVSLSKKVEFRIDPGLEKIWKENPQSPWSSGIEIILHSGERYSHQVDYPLGDPQNPISPEELEEKYGHMASYALSDRKKDLLKSKLYQLDSVPGMADFYKDFM